ncbi:MAG: SCO family protein [Anaerolineae bacterium]|nr:SCO family protein [Anaerolineae bacterium]MDW8172361.1 SCO family protein [Anaerolineae bacterium]
MNKSYRSLVFLISGLVLAISLAALWVLAQRLTRPADDSTSVVFEPSSPDSGITYIDPPRVMPDFTLIDQQGQPIKLSDLRGKPTLISWGYANCPDICPLTLSDYRRMYEELGEDGARVNFVFISVDGARDTPQTLAAVFSRLRVDNIVRGMTGPHEDVMRIGADYGVQARFNPPNEHGFYTIDHTGGSFLLDAQGRWVARYTFAVDRAPIISDIQRLLAAG